MAAGYCAAAEGDELLRLYILQARQRLRWYGLAGGRVLLRHWQWLLVAGLVVPGVPVMPLLELPAHLLVAIVSPGLDWPWRLAGLAVVQVAALLWIAVQRGSIAGGEFAGYAATLPISRLGRRMVDLTLLLAANLLPLLAFGLAIAGQGGTEAVALLLVLATVLTAQLFALHLQAWALVVVAAADVLLTLGLASAGGSVVWPVFALATAVAAFGVFGAGGPARVFGLWGPRRPVVRLPRSVWAPPAVQIQLQALAARPGSSLMRVVAAIVVALGADRLIAALHFDGRALPAAIIALALIALLVSGTYRLLRDAHAPLRTWLASLPLPASYWAVRDTAFVMLLGVPPLLLIVGWLGLNGLAPGVTLVALLGAALALLAVLRLPLVWGGRLATLFGVLIASGWAGTAIAAVVR